MTTTLTSDEREERLKQIRERQAAMRGMSANYQEALSPLIDDMDYVLSLIDSQAATGEIRCQHCDNPIERIGSAWIHVQTRLVSCRKGKSQEHGGIYRAEPATATEWFSDWPAENGFYWLRGWRHYGDLPIKVDGDTFWMMFNLASNHRTDLDDSEDVQFLGPVTPYSAVSAATQMRLLCMETVKDLCGEWLGQVSKEWDERPDLSFDAAERVAAADKIITALESVTFDTEKKK